MFIRILPEEVTTTLKNTCTKRTSLLTINIQPLQPRERCLIQSSRSFRRMPPKFHIPGRFSSMRYRLQRFCISTAGKSESEKFRYRARLDTTHRRCVCVGIVCVINKGVCQTQYSETISEKSKVFCVRCTYIIDPSPIVRKQDCSCCLVIKKYSSWKI